MNLCNNDHEEIRYEGRICPLCDMRDDLFGDIAQLENENENLKDELDVERSK